MGGGVFFFFVYDTLIPKEPHVSGGTLLGIVECIH